MSQHDDNAEPTPFRDLARHADLAAAPLVSRCSGRWYPAVISLFCRC